MRASGDSEQCQPPLLANVGKPKNKQRTTSGEQSVTQAGSRALPTTGRVDFGQRQQRTHLPASDR